MCVLLIRMQVSLACRVDSHTSFTFSCQAPVLLVQNLRKEFPKNEAGCRRDIFTRSSRVVPKVKLAVASTSFAVGNGEVFGLLGPNGAGKTTTLNMISAEIGATEGKVHLFII